MTEQDINKVARAKKLLLADKNGPDLTDEWGQTFFPHLLPVYQRLAVMVLLERMFKTK